MSLTIIALVVGATSLIIGLALAIYAEEYGFVIGAPGIIFIAVAVGAFIIATGSYNHNTGESKERDKIACVNEQLEVMRYNGVDYCVVPGSKIIRVIK